MKITRTLAVLACATAVLVLTSGIATALVWTEGQGGSGDAGDFPASPEQTTTGIGPLTAIDGSMVWAPGDHVDSYSIVVTDPTAFFASTDPTQGGQFIDNGGNEDDSRLYLWDVNGNMVMANDDAPAGFGGSLESFLSDPSTFSPTGGLTNSPGSVVANQKYILSVTYFSNDAQDAAAANLATFSPSRDLHGINPLSTGSFGAWQNPGDADSSWTYRIALGGATFCDVPEPTSLGLLALGVLGLFFGVRKKK